MDDDKRTAQEAEMYIAMVVAMLLVCIAYWFYQVNIWHFTKSALFSLLVKIPEPWHQYIFFYTDYAHVITSIHQNLSESSPAYYFTTSDGYDRKRAIDEASRWFTIPYFAPFILYFAIKAMRGGLGVFQSGVSLQQFAEIQSDIFVYIKPVVYEMKKLTAGKNLDTGPRAISKIPAQWVKDNNLAVTTGTSVRQSLTRKERKTLSLKKQKTFEKLRSDLGRPWRNFDDLKQAELEVLSVIVPHVYGQIAESRIQNRFLALAYSSDKSKEGVALAKYARDELDSRLADFKAKFSYAFEIPFFDDTEFEDPYDPLLQAFQDVETDEQLKDIGDGLVKDAMLTHNYVSTIIVALLVRAWKYGILSSAEMIWIRSVDRELWYLVSQAGRKSAFIECSAAWSHYVSEAAYGFKMLSPQVYPAIKGIDYEMWKTHPNYQAQEGDYDNSDRWDKLVPKIEV